MSGAAIERISTHESARAHALLRELLTNVGSRCAFVFSLDQYWLPQPKVIDLLVVAESVAHATGQRTSLRVLIGRSPEHIPGSLATDSLEQIARQFDAALFDLSKPWELKSVEVSKPWGREVWFTGVEARGVCSVMQGTFAVPIPWLVEICGSLVSGDADKKLVLLKILDPLPEEVFGDLYVELHERKQEVYVVTHVNRTTWPDGIGAIRFGFNQSRVAAYASDAAFREAYLDAVARYRSVRVEIDNLLDDERALCGVALNEPVSAQTQKQWLAALPQALLQREANLRTQMDAFYGSLPLQVGDVVKVPCHVPHSLQHGVTTIEFQTPVYERKILSFGQKVLTQSHWDTQEAMALCGIGVVEPGALELIIETQALVLERIVDFDSFEVFRLTLRAGTQADLADLLRCTGYLILMVVSGAPILNNSQLDTSTAVLLAAMSAPWWAECTTNDAVIVIANPKPLTVY